MRTAKEIINEFKAIADNPRKAMDDYKKETGKGSHTGKSAQSVSERKPEEFCALCDARSRSKTRNIFIQRDM